MAEAEAVEEMEAARGDVACSGDGSRSSLERGAVGVAAWRLADYV